MPDSERKAIKNPRRTWSEKNEWTTRAKRPPTIRNRDQHKLDPSFIIRNGGNGSCVTVDRLPYSGEEQ
jgi:hypothetical protein